MTCESFPSAGGTKHGGAPQLLFGPREAVHSPVHISAIGRGLFRTYRFHEGALKLLPCSLMKKPQPAFTAHAWITEGRHLCRHYYNFLPPSLPFQGDQKHL